VRRALAWTGLVLLGLLLALSLAVGVLLGTTAGSGWALRHVPGLSVEGFAGRLGGAWSADRLDWQGDGRQVDIQSPRFDWSPACLLRLQLCIGRLEAVRIDLQWPPSPPSPTDDEPFSLPQLKLPLSLRLEHARIGRLSVNGTEQLADLALEAEATADVLAIRSLAVRRGDLQLQLVGRVQPGGDWPLEATATLQLPAPDARPWTLVLQADGELQDRVRLAGRSEGYLPGTLDGELRPLAEQLPARLHVVADGFKALASLPDTLTLDGLELTADGNLAEGFAVQGKARFPADGGPIDLALQGRVGADGAQVEALELAADPQHRLSLTGQADWREGLAGELRIDWQDFPWQRLYPLEQPPSVELRRLQAEASYRDGHYLGHFEAAMRGPAGDFSLASPVSGDLAELHLPALQLEAGPGRIEGQLALGFAEGISWDAALTLAGFDPAYWLAELPGTLAGPLRSSGRFGDGRLAVQASLELAGRLRGQPARLALQAQGADARWQLDALDLRLGANRIQGDGLWSGELRGRLGLDLPQLGQLWPGLQGSAKGTLQLAGSPTAPQGKFDLEGRGLGLDDRRMARLTANASLDARQHGRLTLEAAGISLGERRFGTLTVEGQGDRQRQQLNARLDGPELVAELGLGGTLQTGAQGWSWRGEVQRGRLGYGGQTWALEQPARLQRLASGELDLGAHCWQSGPASLCGGAQRLQPEPRLRYQLRHFPLDSLAQWMPDDFAWHGELNGELSVDLPAAGPNGSVHLDAGPGALRLRDASSGQWVDLPYRTLALDSRLRPQRVDSTLAFAGDRLGQLDVQLAIDPRPQAKPLEGRFQLRGVDLSVARPFVSQVDELAGRLDGEGRLGGTLQAPRVGGQLRLTQGTLGGGSLPLRLDDLQVRADIAGERLQLSGGWRSGDQGRATVGGSVGWQDGPGVDVQLRGSRLAVDVEPYAQLEVSPDLRLSLAGDHLAIAGQVEVPRGQIEIRQLPPSTVKVSPDTVIVGQQAPQRAALQVAMDVEVQVGQDKLSFSGFGLQADLAGHVHIGDNLDTRGELQLKDGRYRAYGQRLTIRRARLLFAGPVDQPYLDVEAVRKVEDVTAGIRLRGNASAPTSEVFSEPAMSQEQALSYLVLGRPLGNNGEDNNLLAQAALGLGLAGSASTAGRLASDLGIKDFQLDTEGTGKGTSVTASGRITDRLTLRYGVGVFEPANTIGLRYQLTRRLFLEAASGLASSLDLFYKRDF
jgi:translocation and assembly module TamB